MPESRSLRVDAARNQERILAAARASLEESGAAFSLEDVAGRAGVGVATLYRRFAGRQDLLRAVFERFFAEEIEPIVRAATAEPEPWHGLTSGLHGIVAAVMANGALLRTANEAGVITAEVGARFLHPLEDLLARAQEQGIARPDLRPADLSAIVTMAVTSVSAGRNEPAAPGGWRRYLALLLDGCRAAGTPAPLPDRDDAPR